MTQPRWITPSGDARAKAGCIVTVVNEQGKTLTLHRNGKGALERALDDALNFDPTFRVISISTPESIYTDLNGRMENPRTHHIHLPEQRALSRAGRSNMIHPSLEPRSNDARRKHRERGDGWA